MKEILLIRHGDKEPDLPAYYDQPRSCPNPPLTPKGQQQARQLAAYLSSRPGMPVARIYSSDLDRALQTSAAIVERLGCPVEIRAGLREINMGRFFHQTWEEIRQEDPGFVAAWMLHESDLPYPGGENGADVLRRSLPVVEEILASPDSCAAIVTHAGNIRALVCHVLGAGLEKRFKVGAPLETTSITTLRYDPRDQILNLHAVNETPHLQSLEA
jgi:broad specificity phosphatase PhoE